VIFAAGFSSLALFVGLRRQRSLLAVVGAARRLTAVMLAAGWLLLALLAG
jgi:hypothetical protein